MNYIEKVRYLRKRQKLRDYEQDKYFIDTNFKNPCWQDGEIDKILKSYSYVPNSYIEFIKEFDGLGLTFCIFHSSEKTNIRPIFGEIEELSQYTDCFKAEYFPFAADGGGGIFAFNKKQEIILYEGGDYEFERPEKIADSFEEFVGECLMGKRMAEFDTTEDNKYYDFIKSLGWV